jgi:hypothetical protein
MKKIDFKSTKILFSDHRILQGNDLARDARDNTVFWGRIEQNGRRESLD